MVDDEDTRMPNDQVTLTLDGQTVTVPAGTTLLEAARQAGGDVPVICYHEATTSNGLCRMCVVEVEGRRLLQAACVTPVEEGMVVHTRSPRVERSRRTILEMLDAAVDLGQAPEIQDLLATYNADPDRFPGAQPRAIPLIDDNPFYVRDYSQCVLCWRCVQVCADDAQYTYAINFSGRGFETSIGTFYDKPMPETTCVFCGQCVGVCPTGALKPKRQWLFELGYTPDEVMEMTRTERRRRMRREANNGGSHA